MIVHVLLNLLSELRKRDKCKVCPGFYRFFAMSLTEESECYMTKPHVWRTKLKMLPYIRDVSSLNICK